MIRFSKNTIPMTRREMHPPVNRVFPVSHVCTSMLVSVRRLALIRLFSVGFPSASFLALLFSAQRIECIQCVKTIESERGNVQIRAPNCQEIVFHRITYKQYSAPSNLKQNREEKNRMKTIIFASRRFSVIRDGRRKRRKKQDKRRQQRHQ